MNIKMDKLEELLSLLKKKEDEKQKNYSPLGTGYHRRSCSSCRNRICSISLLCSGLSGRLRGRL